MGKPSGFLDYEQVGAQKDPVEQRIQNFKEFERPLKDDKLKLQAARCMDCGTPFCNWGCPVENLIPEFNDLVYKNQWQAAYYSLISTNNFPEFTGRICPAPCEPACCADLPTKPVTIKQIELSIIEKAFQQGWVKPYQVKQRSGVRIAIVGSGPAGLAAAQQLNLAGHLVSVFEKHTRIGGLLTYGIPDFKLEKWVVQRRVELLEQEGIKFYPHTTIGVDYSIDKLQQEFDYICLCCGAEQPRALPIKGQNKPGVHWAMDFLLAQNRQIAKKDPSLPTLNAKDKHVVVVGGGDTGVDCIGTSIRQGCRSVTQVQIHKQLPADRYATNPWPYWPKVFQTTASHEEGAVRIFSANVKEISGTEKVQALRLKKLHWPEGEIQSGQRNFEEIGEQFEIPCDLLLIAMGFEHTPHAGLVEQLDLGKNRRGNITINNFETTTSNIFAAGDMVEGANLVVTAIFSGRKLAQALDTKICGYSNLP